MHRLHVMQRLSSRVCSAYVTCQQAFEPPDPSHAFESATATVDTSQAADDDALANAARQLLEDIVGTLWRGAAAAPPSAGTADTIKQCLVSDGSLLCGMGTQHVSDWNAKARVFSMHMLQRQLACFRSWLA